MMKTIVRKKYFCLLCIVALVSFLSLSAHASYSVGLTSYQGALGETETTGEIYGSANRDTVPPTSTSPFFFCLQSTVNVYVPGTYSVTESALTGDFLRAAWLMNFYAPTWNGPYAGYSFQETGLAVQYAIWDLINQPLLSATDRVKTLAVNLYSLSLAQDPANLGFLQSSYYRMNLDGTTVQDLIGGGPNPVVPIPAAAWLLGSGLVGLVVVRRRMKK